MGSRLGFLTEWTVSVGGGDGLGEEDIELRHTPCGRDPLPEINCSYTLAELVEWAEAHRCDRG